MADNNKKESERAGPSPEAVHTGVRLTYEASEGSGTHGVAYGSISADVTERLEDTVKTLGSQLITVLGETAKAVAELSQARSARECKLVDENVALANEKNTLNRKLEEERAAKERAQVEAREARDKAKASKS